MSIGNLTPLFGQDDPCPEFANHPERKRLMSEYLRSHLTVSVGYLPKSPWRVPSTVDPASYKHWSVYQGEKPLSEVAFFHLCGHEVEATKVKAHYSSAKRLIRTGWTIEIIGILMMTIGSFKSSAYRYSRPEWGLTLMYVSIPICGAGFYLVHTGYTKKYRSWATYGMAKEIADEYNRRLCQKLIGKP